MSETPIHDDLANGDTTEAPVTETDPTTLPAPDAAPAIAAGLRTMADSAYPGNIPRQVNGKTPDIVLIYSGGDTVHAWSDGEIAAMPERYRWPCWVRSNPESHDPGVDAAAFVNWLRAHHVPTGTAVILDLETAVNGPFVNAFNQLLRIAGYHVTKYGSQNTIWDNPKTDGGTFLALPGNPELTGEGDEVARQYAFDGTFDLSVVKDQAHVPLWDVHPPHGPYVHHADGTRSLQRVAEDRGTTVAHLVAESRAGLRGQDLVLFERYLAGHMAAGTPYCTSNP